MRAPPVNRLPASPRPAGVGAQAQMLGPINSLSVKWKVIVPVGMILLIGFGASTYIITDLARRDLAASAATTADALGAAVDSAMRHSMTRGEHFVVRSLVERLAMIEGVGGVRVLDPSGRTWMGALPGGDEEEALAARIAQAVEQEGRIRYQGDDGAQVALWVIESQPGCGRCHGERQVLGAVEAAVSGVGAQQRTLEALRRMLMVQVAAFILVGVAIGVVVHATVQYPISRLMRTMGRVERGDLSARARVRAHDEIGRLRERFNQMVEQIETSSRELARTQQQLAQSEKLASIGLLAAGVAHEINNPLATISVAAESLLESAATDRERELARAVGEQAVRIAQIVGQLISFDYSRELDLAPGEVREVIEEALALAPLGEIRVSRHYEPHLPQVPMDADKLRRAFANIVRNALHAMGERGELAIAARCHRGAVEVSFTDTGPGIPQERLSRIFDPFFTSKEVGEGTGLGLTITYQVIKMHHGEVEVHSPAREGAGGTRFVIRLPAAQGGNDEPGP